VSQNCFFTNRPQNRDIGLLKIAFCVKFRCASFDFWSKKTNIRAGFRIWTSHPGRASHPDRAGHPIRSYLGYVWPYIYPMCAIRAYMAIYGPIWDQISPTTALPVSASLSGSRAERGLNMDLLRPGYPYPDLSYIPIPPFILFTHTPFYPI